MLLNSIPGIGQIISLVILYEIYNINRFPRVQDFASYARLVKCKAKSAGKSFGTSGAKIGNAHLKCAFYKAAVIFLRGNPKAKAYVSKMTKKHNKGKDLSILAHKLGRAVYCRIYCPTSGKPRRLWRTKILASVLTQMFIQYRPNLWVNQ